MKLQSYDRNAGVLHKMLFGWFILALAGCGKPLTDLDRMAASSSIDDAAPVVAHVRAEVHAPAERVWSILVNLPSWPTWQPAIESVGGSPLSAGSSFDWTTGGTTIHSTVQLFEPSHRLSWTGKAYTAKAVHVWTLSAIGADETTVAIDESMEGPLMARLFSSRQLQEVDTKWLEALKRQAESTVQTR